MHSSFQLKVNQSEKTATNLDFVGFEAGKNEAPAYAVENFLEPVTAVLEKRAIAESAFLENLANEVEGQVRD